VASDLVGHLARCRQVVQAHLRTCWPDTPFFPHATGRPYRRSAVRHAFHQLLDRAGIPRVSGGRRLRVHDTRQHAGFRIMPGSRCGHGLFHPLISNLVLVNSA
jgi:hypothetical protein